MRNGITLAYGCRNGACGSCKGKVLQGQVDYGEHAAHILPDFEKKLGFALFCRAKPLADLVIEAREINAAGRCAGEKAALPRAAHRAAGRRRRGAVPVAAGQ